MPYANIDGLTNSRLGGPLVVKGGLVKMAGGSRRGYMIYFGWSCLDHYIILHPVD